MATVPSSTHDHRPGTIRAALAYRDFRILFIGTALSNVGTWMQNFTLPAYVDAETGSAATVGLFVFAALGPLLLLSIPAGILADKLNRTRLVAAMQAAMLLLTVALAALVALDASLVLVFFAQLGIGIANTLQAPAFNASVPMLVSRADLPGAISLNSAMINGSRIAGPSLAALLAALGMSIPQLFLVNAATFLFLIIPLFLIALPQPAARPGAKRGLRAIGNGIEIVRQRKVLRNCLLTMCSFSLLCLPFVGLFPSIARLNFGIDPEGGTYKALYVTWGAGAFLGATSVGTWFASVDKRELVRRTLLGFAAAITVFALVDNLMVVFPIAAALGAAYFMTATSLATVLQQNLADDERGSVMPLWFMAFGGTVPIGNIIGGPIVDAVGATPVLLFGAVAAVAVVRLFDLRRLGAEAFLPEEHGGERFVALAPSRFI